MVYLLRSAGIAAMQCLCNASFRPDPTLSQRV
jgi:hypothetical protein